MHGLNQGHGSLRQLVRWLDEAMPGVYVRNLELGDGQLDSYFVDLNAQVSAICATLSSEPALAGGFNAIGLNQGALLLRGYIQRCNAPAVHTYISLGGPQCGVVSVPQPHDTLADVLLQNGAYGHKGNRPRLSESRIRSSSADSADDVQQLLSVAQYWRDPFKLDEYVRHSTFLADLNNERADKQESYKRQLTRLAAFVMVMFDHDTQVAAAPVLAKPALQRRALWLRARSPTMRGGTQRSPCGHGAALAGDPAGVIHILVPRAEQHAPPRPPALEQPLRGRLARTAHAA